MILIGMGGNLASAVGPPPLTFASALAMFRDYGIAPKSVSRLYASPAWPIGQGPDFFNLAVCVDAHVGPGALLQSMLKIEAAHGRSRRSAWAPRTLDLDLLDYHNFVSDADHLTLPHPWIEERAFVLKPMFDIARAWLHPVSGLTIPQLLDALSSEEAGQCAPTADQPHFLGLPGG